MLGRWSAILFSTQSLRLENLHLVSKTNTFTCESTVLFLGTSDSFAHNPFEFWPPPLQRISGDKFTAQFRRHSFEAPPPQQQKERDAMVKRKQRKKVNNNGKFRRRCIIHSQTEENAGFREISVRGARGRNRT